MENNVLDILNNRMSLRKYKDKPISEKHLNLILEGAMRAPTAGNMMMYSIITIKDKDKKKKLSETCDNQPFIAKSPVILVFLADMQRLYDYFEHCNVKKFCDEKNITLNAPDASELFLAAGDAFIAAQNAVVAAESLGIGSCYIGDIVEHCDTHKKLLNLPDKVIPLCMLCLGYYENNKRIISPRFDKKYIIFDEEYKRLSHEDFDDMYKEREGKLPKVNKYDAKNFGQFLYGRKLGTAFREEMNNSLKLLFKYWNKL